MMKMHVDTAYRSLFKYGEELCGDNVRITRTEDSVFAVLADGLGSCLLYTSPLTSQGFVYKGVVDNSGISIVGKGHLG